jgi:hypothetical protein
MERNIVKLFLKETVPAIIDQLERDQRRWGDVWLKRTRKGQEWRIFKRYLAYFLGYFIFKRPISWLKVIGNAHIALARDNHPEVWVE